jgi:5-methylcytosine-specific restriction endonuclease McrA
VQAILPITRLVLETGTFDPHALKNPEVLRKKWLYQKGINYGFANTKAYVLTRDNYTCQHCQGKTHDRRLEVHHLVFRIAPRKRQKESAQAKIIGISCLHLAYPC